MTGATVDLTLWIIHETEAAFLVSDGLEGDDEKVWLPKSQVEVTKILNHDQGAQLVDMEVAEWLAVEKELV